MFLYKSTKSEGAACFAKMFVEYSVDVFTKNGYDKSRI